MQVVKGLLEYINLDGYKILPGTKEDVAKGKRRGRMGNLDDTVLQRAKSRRFEMEWGCGDGCFLSSYTCSVLEEPVGRYLYSC